MKLTQRDIFDLIDEIRQTFEPEGVARPHATIKQIVDKLCEKFKIAEFQELNSIAHNQLNKYKRFTKDKKKSTPDNSTCLIDTDDYETYEPTPQPSKPSSPRIADEPTHPEFQQEPELPVALVTELSTSSPAIETPETPDHTVTSSITNKRQASEQNDTYNRNPKRKRHFNSYNPEYKRKLLKPLKDAITETANEHDVTYECLLGHLLSLSRKQDISEVGKAIYMERDCSQIPIDTTLAIYSDCMLGRHTYTKTRKMLRAYSVNILPAWRILRDAQKSLTPEIRQLPSEYDGLYFSMTDAIRVTVERILSQQKQALQDNDELHLQIKFGFDGSGSHAIYNQINNADTNNIIMTMFCPLKITTNQNTVIYEQPLPNSALSQRILCIQMGKETITNLNSLQVYNEEIKNLRDTGISVQASNSTHLLKSEVISHMLDGKAAKLYTGLGGAYCDLCNYSKDDCENIAVIHVGFTITRKIKDTIDFFADHSNEQGEVIKSGGDYYERGGACHNPIQREEVKINSMPVLHSLLRCFDHYMQVVVHIKAGVFKWSPSPTGKEFMKKAKVNNKYDSWDF